MSQVFGSSRSSIFSFLISLLLGLNTPLVSFAEDQDLLLGISKLMNLPEESAEVLDFADQIDRKIISIRNGINFPATSKQSVPPSNSRHPSKPEPSLEETFSKINIIKHFRRQDGIPFETWEPEAELAESDKASSLKAWNHFDTGLRDAITALSNTPPLPLCEKERSVKEVIAPELLRVVPKDLLFIRSKPVKDPDELFGRDVSISYCTNEKGDGCAISASQIGITCLPTRFRVEGKNIVRYEGEGALKNYDSNKRGEFHEVVKLKLREFLGR